MKITPSLREKLEAYRRAQMQEIGFWVAGPTAIILVLQATMTDRLHYPELWDYSWLALRLGIVPVSIIAVLTLRTKFGRLYPDFPVCLVAIYVASFHAYLVTITGYLESSYLHAFVQTLLAVSVVPVSITAFALTVIFVCASYLVAAMMGPLSDWNHVMHGNPTFLTTYVLMTILLYFTFRHARRQGSLAQILLEEDLKEREQTIQRLVDQRLRVREAEVAFRLATQVAHDIRSPLSALNLVSSTLQDIPEDKRQLVNHATQRINDIANSLLLKAKSSQAESQGNCAPVSTAVSPLIEAIVRETRVQLNNDIEILVQVERELIVQVIESEFSRVIANLIRNSIEALPGRGRIQIVAEGDRFAVRVSVSDNGCGIPSAVLEKLGQRGVSHGKSGSGLGLHHAKSTVEAAGGRISFESQVGQGTIVRLTLPRSLP